MTKKNRILTLVLSILSVVVLIVVLSGTIFTVGKVEVRWLSERGNLSTLSEQEIVEISELKAGSSVFFVSKDNAVDKLEKEYPYIAVSSIETLFPNTLIIHARERDEVFALQLTSKYLLVDSDFKVLKIISGDFIPTHTSAIKITSEFDFGNYEAGDFINVDASLACFKTLQQSFYQNYKQEDSENALTDMLDLLKSATYTDTKIIFKTFLGVEIEIYNPSVNQQKKVAMIYEVLAGLDAELQSKGTIIIGDNSQGKVQGSHTQQS